LGDFKSFSRNKGGGTEIHHVLDVGFGLGIIRFWDLPAIYQATPFTAKGI